MTETTIPAQRVSEPAPAPTGRPSRRSVITVAAVAVAAGLGLGWAGSTLFDDGTTVQETARPPQTQVETARLEGQAAYVERLWGQRLAEKAASGDAAASACLAAVKAG